MSNLSKIFPRLCTRNMYCENCARNQMPRVNNLALMYGTDSSDFYVLKVKDEGFATEYGFTPHLIINPVIRVIEKELYVLFEKVCSMNGCGVDLVFNPYNNLYHRTIEVSYKKLLPISEFIALLNYKDKEYYILQNNFLKFKRTGKPFFFVPGRGLEPPPLARFDFESNAATITPPGQRKYHTFRTIKTIKITCT